VDEVPDPVGQDARLAGAGAGDDEERTFGAGDRLALRLVQVREVALGGRDGHRAMLPATPAGALDGYQATVSSTCAGILGPWTTMLFQVIRQVYVPLGSGS